MMPLAKPASKIAKKDVIPVTCQCATYQYRDHEDRVKDSDNSHEQREMFLDGRYHSVSSAQKIDGLQFENLLSFCLPLGEPWYFEYILR
jgi:hypothetical protein